MQNQGTLKHPFLSTMAGVVHPAFCKMFIRVTPLFVHELPLFVYSVPPSAHIEHRLKREPGRCNTHGSYTNTGRHPVRSSCTVREESHRGEGTRGEKKPNGTIRFFYLAANGGMPLIFVDLYRSRRHQSIVFCRRPLQGS